IAATYTPFIVQLKESYLAIALLAGVWCVAIGGVALKLARPGRYDRLAVGLYLALGWSGVTLYDAVLPAVPPLALGFVVAGGVLYSLGVIFHAWQRLRFQNAIWHGFVLLGAACHYTAILDMVSLTYNFRRRENGHAGDRQSRGCHRWRQRHRQGDVRSLSSRRRSQGRRR